MGSRLRSRMRISPGSMARPKEARPSPLSSQCLICAAMRAASVSAGFGGGAASASGSQTLPFSCFSPRSGCHSSTSPPLPSR